MPARRILDGRAHATMPKRLWSRLRRQPKEDEARGQKRLRGGDSSGLPGWAIGVIIGSVAFIILLAVGSSIWWASFASAHPQEAANMAYADAMANRPIYTPPMMGYGMMPAPYYGGGDDAGAALGGFGIGMAIGDMGHHHHHGGGHHHHHHH